MIKLNYVLIKRTIDLQGYSKEIVIFHTDERFCTSSYIEASHIETI